MKTYQKRFYNKSGNKSILIVRQKFIDGYNYYLTAISNGLYIDESFKQIATILSEKSAIKAAKKYLLTA